uniref:Uncharacterized protein n=1 Tax=Panagrolaimus sp. ES5 TaxID=591445 RepID=A0AC34GMV1_9BILA
MEGPLPTSTGTDYYSSISDNAIGGGSMDIFINNHQQHHSQNQLFDAKALQSSLFDDEDSNNPTTSNFPIIFEQPLNLNEEIPSNEGAAAATINSGTSNNDAMEFFSLLQSQINDLRAENDLLRGHLKTTDERLVEIEKRLKINRKEIPA